MLSNKSLLILSLLLVATALSAFSITDSHFGYRYGALDARGFAMGSAGMYNNMRPAGFVMNPANLTAQQKTVGLDVNGLINRSADTRMIPLYNSFDNYIDDAVYASNINAFTDFAGAGFGSFAYEGFRFGVGAYHMPYSSFDGKYREEIRNNRNTDNDGYPEKIAQNDIENEGALLKTGLAFAVAYEYDDYWNVNLGFDFALMNADVTQETSILWTDWSHQQVGDSVVLPEYRRLAKWELEGQQYKIGAAFRLGPRFGLGFTFVPKTTLDRSGSDYTRRDAYRNTPMDSTFVDLEGDFDLPSEMRIGLSYFPRNIMNTVFSMDVEQVSFSEAMDVFEDAYNIYVGVEHHVAKRIPLRLGFQAVNSYHLDSQAAVNEAGEDITLFTANKILTPMVTGGSSVQIAKNVVLDLGFGYAWREYEALDLFGDAYYNDKTYTGSGSYSLWPTSYIDLQNRGWENPDKVKESFITLNAGLSFSW
ncbi:MAG: hypothetical protein RBR69_05550 [Candidatus Cloacimonadaceae bacterium]|jgi:hypothetical protein|nr:hypothetical protein [Candidatus Cloacimonadota bacterium]MDY0127576.1 hypothetical protein [Candidatus Cloacimonadaceae bacterium]MCB5255438.1 hypothetical protein [Candidatus Cloacimonadota bacterium]MCK9177893.1 hypothetical protein [Candidatus Cloacimonadota bacterium]MCK9242032.1 hypothetical protein [Candidatus Cloacimonadota bacterium]